MLNNAKYGYFRIVLNFSGPPLLVKVHPNDKIKIWNCWYISQPIVLPWNKCAKSTIAIKIDSQNRTRQQLMEISSHAH